MTLLEIIRKKKIATATDATVATDTPKLAPSVANVASVAVAKQESVKVVSPIPYKQESAIKAWLSNIGEPESDHYLVLNKCRRDPEALAYYLERVAESKREERYKKVLDMLADKPATKRAFITDMDSGPDNVILTIAIRDQYTFEMTISKDKYDPFLLLELIGKGPIQ